MSDAATESEGWEGSSWLSSILVHTISIKKWPALQSTERATGSKTSVQR